MDAAVEARLRRIDARFDADPDRFIESTEELTLEDYAFLGQLIQLYCFADYCARRIIDAIREAAFGPEKRNASKRPNKRSSMSSFQSYGKSFGRRPTERTTSKLCGAAATR